MNLDELMKRAAEDALSSAEVDAVCEEEQINFTEFSERLARHVATAYHERRLEWIAGDTAMNRLHGFASIRAGHEWLSDFAFSAFLAFDAGEYHPQTPNLSADDVTRQLIGALLDAPTGTPNKPLQPTRAAEPSGQRERSGRGPRG